jgi:hypothetical protein
MSCSHCHEMNLIRQQAGRCVPTACRNCDRRADVPRSECDCKLCRPTVQQLQQEAWSDQVGEE